MKSRKVEVTYFRHDESRRAVTTNGHYTGVLVERSRQVCDSFGIAVTGAQVDLQHLAEVS